MDHLQRLSLNDSLEEGVVLEDDAEQENSFNWQWSFVGRLLTDRNINFNAMKHSFVALWRRVKGVYVKDLGPNLFIFQFRHALDFKRVTENGPWTFDNHMLLLKILSANDQPSKVLLFEASFWVQIYDVPIGFMLAKLVQSAGNYIGKFQASDQNNFDGQFRTYLRVRVLLDVSKPLKTGMKIKKIGGDWFWQSFRYERLPTFCFVCGIIGHSESFCIKVFDADKVPEKPYGPWLRAPTRKPQQHITIGEKWLRSNWTLNDATPATDTSDPSEFNKTVKEGQSSSATEDERGKGKEVISGENGVTCGDVFHCEMTRIDGKQFDVSPTNKSNSQSCDSTLLNYKSKVSTSIVIAEPKRRRVEEDDFSCFMDAEAFVCDDQHGPINPKNAAQAGPVVQARPAP